MSEFIRVTREIKKGRKPIQYYPAMINIEKIYKIEEDFDTGKCIIYADSEEFVVSEKFEQVEEMLENLREQT